MRRPRADDFPDGQCDELAHPDGRSEREGAAAAAEHGIQVEWHLYADHVGSDFP